MALSRQQLKMFFLWLYDQQSTYYNNPGLLSIKGPLDIERLQKAIAQIVSESDSLRSFFYLNDAGTPCVAFKDPSTEYSLAHENVAEQDLSVRTKQLTTPFDLRVWPLFRFQLLTLSGHHHLVFADFHHIIADGSSISLFAQSVMECYLNMGQQPLVPYSAYVHWQHQYLNSNRYQKDKQYWVKSLNQHGSFDPLPYLPASTATNSSRYEQARWTLPAKNILNLQSIAIQQTMTLYTLLMGLFVKAVSKTTAQRVWSVGCTALGRPDHGFDSCFGMFVNTVPIRFTLEEDERLFFSALKTTMIDAIEHSQCPLEDVIPLLTPRPKNALLPFFDMMFVFQPETTLAPFVGWNTEPLDLELIPLFNLHTKTPLNVLLIPNNHELQVILEFDPNVIEATNIKKWGQTFIDLCTIFEREYR
jgi:hypothetical protein